ncbi:MAG: type II toxin-antitoxin system RelE/ParE family toxin [Gemmataceae bacterium]|nr:type II toxin-antitoxin system RelE/ParE family toxin [Gemmataceae bacterium]
MKLRITPRARTDLDDVWDYVSPAGKTGADRYVTRIRKQCRMLARFPGMGRPRDELAVGLRSFAVSPFVIFFRIEGKTVEILRILHGARDFAAIWRKGE